MEIFIIIIIIKIKEIMQLFWDFGIGILVQIKVIKNLKIKIANLNN